MAFTPNNSRTASLLYLFSLFCFANCLVLAAALKRTEPEGRRLLTELFRGKRQQCVDGTYEYDGRTCCLCGAGQHLKEHCTKTPADGTCELCIEGSTFNSEPNYKDKCELCTSCTQENANLEEEEACTAYKDTKCRCKKDHYCETEVCKICQPCSTCESTGVKEPCSATRDAVCNEESTGLGSGAIAGIVLTVLFLSAVVGVVVYKLFKKPDSTSSPVPVSEPLLGPVDMEKHIPDVAEILGWKVMRLIALNNGMSTAIENAQHSHPHDSEMWTIEILKQWVEMKGSSASVDLIKILQEKKQNKKAGKIKAKLYGANAEVQTSSV